MLSRRVAGLDAPWIDQLKSRADTLAAGGADVISLGQAVPGFPPPASALRPLPDGYVGEGAVGILLAYQDRNRLVTKKPKARIAVVRVRRFAVPRLDMKPAPPPMPKPPPSDFCSNTAPIITETIMRWMTMTTVCMVPFRHKPTAPIPAAYALFCGFS